MLRQVAIGVVIAVALVGAAVAQDDTIVDAADSAGFSPDFEPWQPTGRTFPERAMLQGASGIVHLCCRARENRTLDCSVGYETSEPFRFGRASIDLLRTRKLTPESYAELQTRETQAFRIPLRWQSMPVPENLDEVAEHIDNTTENLSGPGTGGVRPDSHIEITASVDRPQSRAGPRRGVRRQ